MQNLRLVTCGAGFLEEVPTTPTSQVVNYAKRPDQLELNS